MNNLLQLKGNFEQKKSSSKPRPSNIPKNKYVSTEHLKNLKQELINILDFWKNEELLINPLISLYYIDIIAKSNRIKGILENGEKNNKSIVGAKFTNSLPKKHIITHCVSITVLEDAIKNLDIIIKIIKENFGNKITHENLNDIIKNKIEINFSKNKFINTIVDSYYLEKFGIEHDNSDLKENAIITLYDTGVKTSDIMKQLNINFLEVRSIDETTLLLTPDQYNLLKSKAPYLISMAVSDISTLEKENVKAVNNSIISIPEPKNEPIIGVIDTLFDENVYFSNWVEFKNMINPEIELNKEDYIHGTMVTSIIVDGSTINPDMNDGCGRFRARHFGVIKSGKFSSFTVLKNIKEIVESNRDIKVWNLSLGSSMEINPNFISPEAAILDKIQYEYDVIFVISGTNKPKNSKIIKIGAPADSINSLVVNSVRFDGYPTDYSREGLVLSFFNKPDVSYYGGDHIKKIRTCSPLGEAFVSGTSFAAPWISRKLSYLIEILGLSRELAKALIIDSATAWSNQKHKSQLIGHGIVPININDIIKTPSDEIKFMINGISEKFETYNYNLPIPLNNGKHPFVSKATLCYFPKCSRNQGVDYTNTEMDIHFGRLKKGKNGEISINSINDNKQSEECKILMYEGKARDFYRKWDNVKHIRENLKTPSGRTKKPKIKFENNLWGISIKTKERLNSNDGNNLKFGLVVTIKEVNGINRIEDFIKGCQFKGWLVRKVNIENKIDIYNKAEEEIEFK